MKKIKPLVLLLYFTNSFAQSDSVSYPQKEHKKRLYRRSGDSFWQTEKSIGVVPEINFLHNYTIGLGFSKANFCYGEGSITGFGFNGGFNYSPVGKLSIPYASIWFSRNVFVFLGFYGGIKALYYTNEKTGNTSIRPEIGFGLGKFNFFYGFNLFLNSEIANVSRHSLTISYYITIYPKEKEQ